MSETTPQTDSENNDATKHIEDAFAAMLSKPNPIDLAHQNARIAEDYLNDYIRDLSDDEDHDEEVGARTGSVITELDSNCGHMGAEIVVNGFVKMRNVDHRLIESGMQQMPPEAMLEKEEMELVEDRVATSMGYFAIQDGRNDNVISIYHGARLEPQRVFYSDGFGDMFKAGRIFMPVDGTVTAELVDKPPREINYGLLKHYVDAKITSRVDEAIFYKESLTESIRALGRISLLGSEAIIRDESVRHSLIDYINMFLHIKEEIPYEIKGASSVDYEDDEGNIKSKRISPRAAVGNITGIGIDEKVGRFMLLTSMPFADDTSRDIAYRINQKLTVRQLPAFTLDV